MSSANAGKTADTTGEKLPLRDWILLPLLSVLTLAALAFSFKAIGGRMLAATDPIGDCIVLDSSKTPRGVPNGSCWKKAAESAPVEYSFNSCGHRAGMECGQKAPGTYRIVMAGSSYAFGWAVKREQSFAALVPIELSQRTGRNVELYNASMIGVGGIPRTVAARFNEILSAQPDVILWTVTPWDVDKADRLPVPWIWMETGDAIKYHLRQAIVNRKPLQAIPAIVGTLQDKFIVSRPGRLIQHYLFESQSEYLKIYLESGQQGGFLKAQPDPDWQYRLRLFDGYAAEIEGRANAAGVPIIVVLMPNRAQAAMISMHQWPAGYDPYKLGDELNAIVASHGGTYIDILHDFSSIPNPERYYYSLDNHPDVTGNAIIARFLSKELTTGLVPALRGAGQSQYAVEKGH